MATWSSAATAFSASGSRLRGGLTDTGTQPTSSTRTSIHADASPERTSARPSTKRSGSISKPTATRTGKFGDPGDQRGGRCVLLLVADDLFRVGQELREPVVRVTRRHPRASCRRTLRCGTGRGSPPPGPIRGRCPRSRRPRGCGSEAAARRGRRRRTPRRTDGRATRRRSESVVPDAVTVYVMSGATPVGTATVLDSWFSTMRRHRTAGGDRAVGELDVRRCARHREPRALQRADRHGRVHRRVGVRLHVGLGSRELTGRKSVDGVVRDRRPSTRRRRRRSSPPSSSASTVRRMSTSNTTSSSTVGRELAP